MSEIDCYSWEDIDALSRRLAQQIRESGRQFDVLVAILRGGAVPGTILANELDIEQMLGTKIVQDGQVSGVADAIVDHKAGREERAYAAQRGRIVVPLNDIALEGRRILVVDDVLDSGESARCVLDEISAHGAADVALATLQIKTYSSFRPDFFVETKTNWLFYPWMSAAELESMRERREAAV